MRKISDVTVSDVLVRGKRRKFKRQWYCNPAGGFIKLYPASGATWQEVGDHLAREKVGQTIWAALHCNYRSSTKAKKTRRQAEQAKAEDGMTIISSAHTPISSKIEGLMVQVRNTRECSTTPC